MHRFEKHKRLEALASLAVLVAGLAAGAVAQESPEADEPLQQLRSLYQNEAKSYRFQVGEDELQLVAEPVMTWTGTEGWSGDVYVWTRDGRPEMIGGIGSWPDAGRRHLFHEFHRLSGDRLTDIEIGDILWSPADGQVELRALADGPAPADSESLRLVQMRRLAARFEPHMLAQAGDEALRLLPRPLYRYHNPTGEILDGALFGYVFSTTGTDLDFVLLLECRRTDRGPIWHFAPARFTRRELRLLYDGEEVWRVAWQNEPGASKRLEQPYVTVTVRSIDDAQFAPQ